MVLDGEYITYFPEGQSFALATSCICPPPPPLYEIPCMRYHSYEGMNITLVSLFICGSSNYIVKSEDNLVLFSSYLKLQLKTFCLK